MRSTYTGRRRNQQGDPNGRLRPGYCSLNGSSSSSSVEQPVSGVPHFFFYYRLSGQLAHKPINFTGYLSSPTNNSYEVTLYTKARIGLPNIFSVKVKSITPFFFNMDSKEGFKSKKLVVNVKPGKELLESSKAKISLIGIRRQKNGRYGAQITDGIRHKSVWLGTFDTIEEASAAYFAKKSEFENEKLSHQGNKKTPIVGVHKKNKRGKYNSEITNPITKKRIWLGTFDNAEEASQAYQSKKREFNAMQQQCTNKHTHSEQNGKYEELVSVKQGHENVNCEISQTEYSTGGSETDVRISKACNGGTDQRIDSHSKEASKVFNSCLMANVYDEELSDECNTTISCNPKAMRSFVGIKRQKNRRYAAVITDRVKHRKVVTFDTVEEASHAYFSKKSEYEKLSPQENKENKPTKSFDQIRPESPVVGTLKTASMDRRNKRIDSQGKEPGSSKATSCLMTNVHRAESANECNITTSCNRKVKRSLIGIRRRKSGRYQAVITDPIKHKEVSLGTFDTIEEASQAYFSKKSEFEKLRLQGKRENKLKKNCDQIQQPESPFVVASIDTAASASGRDKRIDSHKTTAHIIGVYKSKTKGRYTSEITNPITKKKNWLGTFDTAEEASHAFQSKKIEFQKLIKAKQQQCTEKKSEKLVNVKQGHENVNCELKSSDGSAEIDVPFSNSSNGGTVQSIDSDKIGAAEEAFHDYQSKKFNLHSSKEVEQKSNMRTDSSAGEKQEGQEDDEDLWMGEWVHLPGDDRAVMFSPKLGLPIIDNYGYLLGEFSSLDDLSILCN